MRVGHSVNLIALTSAFLSSTERTALEGGWDEDCAEVDVNVAIFGGGLGNPSASFSFRLLRGVCGGGGGGPMVVIVTALSTETRLDGARGEERFGELAEGGRPLVSSAGKARRAREGVRSTALVGGAATGSMVEVDDEDEDEEDDRESAAATVAASVAWLDVDERAREDGRDGRVGIGGTGG
jgi:hypothetical protein